jgi:hypothetical protein
MFIGVAVGFCAHKNSQQVFGEFLGVRGNVLWDRVHFDASESHRIAPSY